MAASWAQVSQNPQFQALPPDQQEAARQQYFAQVITPQVPAEHLADAKAQFDAQTGPKQAPEAPFNLGNMVADAPAATGEALAAGVKNIIPAAVNGASDIYNRIFHGDDSSPAPMRYSQPGDAFSSELSEIRKSALGKLVSSGAGAIADRFNQGAGDSFQGDLVKSGLGVARDIAGIAPAANLATSGVSTFLHGGEQPLQGNDWFQAGLRNGQGHPIAAALEDGGHEALSNHNAQIGNTVARSEAALPADADITNASLTQAAEPANSVYNRLATSLNQTPIDLSADDETRGAIQAAGSGRRITTGTPETENKIAALKQQLLNPAQPVTGDQIIEEMRGLRHDGFANAGSEDPDQQRLGSAQLDLSSALENHIANNLPAGGDVSLDQFRAARQQLAKIAAVRGSLVGDDNYSYVDQKALGRINQDNPNQLTGGLQALARFATGAGRDVTSAPTIMGPNTARDLASMVNLHRPVASTIAAIPGVGTLARRILTGGTQNGMDDAAAMFPGRDPRTLAPLDPQTGPLYDADLRRFTTTPGGPGGAPQDPGQGIPLSQVLSHGVEQPGAPGLSLGPMGIHSEGLPFSAPPESVGAQIVHGGAPPLTRVTDDYGNLHWLDGQGDQPPITLGDRIARDATPPDRPGSVIADRPTVPQPGPPGTQSLSELLTDYPGVKSQGVPDGTAQVAGPRNGPTQPWLAGGPGRSEDPQSALMRLLDDLQGVDPTLPKKRPK